MTKIILCTLASCIAITMNAQTGGVSVSPNGSPPDPSSMLDVSSSTKGTLITRMTSAQRDAIANPALSLTIFNTTTNCFEFYAGSSWSVLSCGCQTPSVPQSIIGPSSVCQSQSGVIYTIPSVPNAIGYVWTLPSGATIASGSNTNTISVNFSAVATSGNISVYGYSASCGNGPSSANFPVTVNPLPLSAAGISGPSVACQGQTGVSYSIPSIANAANYQWSYSGMGVTINGSSQSVTLDFDSFATSGVLTVYGVNDCGNGIISPNYPITISNLPDAAGVISGPSGPCINSVGNVYSVGAVSGATSYNWTVPSGASVSSNSGTSVTVSMGNSSGFVSVTPVNACGDGETAYLNVNPITFPSPPDAISGNTFLVASSGNSYSIPPASGATSYNWIITPGGATINSGQGTNAISVTFPATTTNYSICVTASNSCGTTGSSCLPVSVYSNKQIFSATGSNQTFSVPANVNQVFVKIWAAGGGGGINYSGGAGAFVSGNLSVTPNSNLTIIVGGKGLRASGTAAAAGGFGGGGASGASNNVNGFAAGSGGGRSSIQITPGIDAVTAGAGGGCGTGNSGQNDGSYGGGGGAPNGSAGGDNNSGTQGGPGGGKGGTTVAGGAATTAVSPAVNSVAGSAQTGSAGGSSAYAGGGGGGGYFGGSGGAGSTNMTVSHAVGGGGGGSSYTASLTSPVTNLAGNIGNQTGNILPPNTSDPDYASGIGLGGYYSNNGGDGRIVIYW